MEQTQRQTQTLTQTDTNISDHSNTHLQLKSSDVKFGTQCNAPLNATAPSAPILLAITQQQSPSVHTNQHIHTHHII